MSSCIASFGSPDGRLVDSVEGCGIWTREGPGVGETSGDGGAPDEGGGGRAGDHDDSLDAGLDSG